MRTSSEEGARAAGVFRLGGVAPVVRLGYGAMRITGRAPAATAAVTAPARTATVATRVMMLRGLICLGTA
jgi:hypothetical protein